VADGQNLPQIAAISFLSQRNPASLAQNGTAAVIARSSSASRHDVAHGEGEAALGHEAPAADGMALPVQLIDVLQASMVDAVTFAGFGTDDFEGRALLVLGELLGGEPFSEQDPGFGFGVEAVSRLCANGDTRVAFARLQPSGAADNLATANQSV
jgi:hypothetical protein